MNGTRIKSRPKQQRRQYNPTLWTRTIYSVLLSYDCLDGDEWENREMSIPVEAYNKDDAHSAAFCRMEAYLVDKYPKIEPIDFDITIKRVDELPQAVYMRRIGAPELFAVVA